MEGYTQYIRQEVIKYQPGLPIMTDDIINKLAQNFGLQREKARVTVNVCMDRLADNKDTNLRRYQKGIYYITKVTAFGELGIDQTKLAYQKYLAKNNGYETGPALLNKIGLTTQMAREICIATNNAAKRPVNDARLAIRIQPARTRVTGKNLKYLQFLDILELLDRAPVDAPEPKKVLLDFRKANNLDYGQLLAVAMRAKYNKRVIQHIAELAGGDESI